MLDLVHPAVEKVTLVLEGLGGDKIRIVSTSLDQPLTVLPDQALEIGAIAKNAIRPGSCVAYRLNHDAVGVAEVGYGPQRNSYGVTL